LALNDHELDLRLHAAAALAREAGEIAKARFRDRSSFTIGLKGPQDFLTEVDGEVERLIAGRLHKLFPGDGFIGEEGEGRIARGDAPTWVVDPVDGTANFARGVPHFCISIALVHAGGAEVGVIFDPMLDELFCARRGGGAFLNASPIHVSTTKDMKTASIEIGYNMRVGPEKFLAMLADVVVAGSAAQRCGSGALGIAYVAAGRSDAFIEHHINAWDCLAGNVLVAEAGGYVSDFLARDGLSKGNALLTCTPTLLEPLAAIAARAGVVL
jgi:myo-inositol-1(or 4)-monophosphatase